MAARDDSSRDAVEEQLQALGYIDPGAGSTMTQLLLAGFFRISRTVKLFLRKALGRSESGGSMREEE